MNSGIISKDEESKHAKSEVNLKNIKSDFIFKKICGYIAKNISLKIMKYNKKLQKRLNTSIDDYVEYLSIVIELKLDDNKYGTFINISDQEKEYFHIYFDNSNEEIKRNYLEQNEQVKTIKIIINYKVSSIFFQKFL